MRTPTQEKYEDQNIFKIELTVEAPLWNPSSHEFNRQERCMFDYQEWFVSPNTPANKQLSIISVTSYVYDPADVMDNDNYAAMLESFVNTLSLQVAQVNAEKISGLDHLVLAKKWGISLKKALNMIHLITQHDVCTMCIFSY